MEFKQAQALIAAIKDNTEAQREANEILDKRLEEIANEVMGVRDIMMERG